MPVDHHTEAYGIVLSHKDGWKITYSGDTEPCQNLVDAGEFVTLNLLLTQPAEFNFEEYQGIRFSELYCFDA